MVTLYNLDKGPVPLDIFKKNQKFKSQSSRKKEKNFEW